MPNHCSSILSAEAELSSGREPIGGNPHDGFCGGIPARNGRFLLTQEFDHEKLDVYRVSIEFVSVTESVVSAIPKGRSNH